MNSTLDLLPVLEALLAVEDPVLGAELFHGALIAALVEWVAPIAAAMAVGDVVLGGGCLLNRVLAEGLVAGFAAHGLTAWLARAAPSNDGGLALGQAWVAVERL
jgi:hydrogenase maturation protein HypF